MQIKKLKIAYFKTFEEEQVISFDGGAGVNFMCGVNEVASDLGSNAAGKSSVWDALCWVFYGYTTRGLRASGVGNWKSKRTCSVTVYYLDVRGKLRVLTRQWNPVALFFTDRGVRRNVTQEAVVETIKLPQSAFLNTVIIPQFGDSFLDLKPAARERFFSEALDLDYWLELSARASKKASVYGKLLMKLEPELARVLGKLESLDERNYKGDIKRWDEDMRGRIEAVEEDLDKLELNVGSKVTKLARCEKELAHLTEEIHTLEEKSSQYQDKASDIKRIHDDYQYSRDELKHKMAAVKVDYKSLFNLRGGYCRVCNQKVSEEHVLQERESLEKKVDGLDDRIEELNEKLEKCVRKVTYYHNVKKKLNGEIVRKREDRLRLNYKMEELHKGIDSTDSIKKELLEKLETLEDKINPYRIEQEALDRDITLLTQAKMKLWVRLQEAREGQSVFKYWVTGFKEVRLYLLKESLKQLEFEINEIIIKLGLEGWRVFLSTEKLNAKGSVTGKGFEVYVTSPDSPKKVLWESWSGGEAQRLVLAATMGLASLLKSRYGVFPNIEVWDEPTTSMSEEGVLSLLDLFFYRARDLGLQLWLVDHSRIKYAGFNSQVKIKRTYDKGSTIEVISQ